MGDNTRPSSPGNPDTVELPTTSGNVTVAVREEFSFLWTKIGDYKARFTAMKTLIDSAVIPRTLSLPLPLTAIKHWIDQKLVIKIRANPSVVLPPLRS